MTASLLSSTDHYRRSILLWKGVRIWKNFSSEGMARCCKWGSQEFRNGRNVALGDIVHWGGLMVGLDHLSGLFQPS